MEIFFETYPLEEQNSQILKIIQYIFAIPSNSTNVERCFSLIKAQWSDSRNKLLIETIKNLVFINPYLYRMCILCTPHPSMVHNFFIFAL